jgi:hypothetical protein
MGNEDRGSDRLAATRKSSEARSLRFVMGSRHLASNCRSLLVRLSGPIRATYFRIVYAHLGGISPVVSGRLARSRQAFSDPKILGWRSQRFLREVEAIRHIVGSLISCIQWLQPKRNF